MEPITMSDLSHRSKDVLARLREQPPGTRVPVTRGGRLVAYLLAADPGEQWLDERAERGEIAHDWRARHPALLETLRAEPPVPADQAGSNAVLTDRRETDR